MKHALPILLLLLFISICSFAQPGTLDSTYGINGVQRAALAVSIPGIVGYNIVLTPDHKIITGGENSKGIIIEKRNSNGTADNSFGDSGIAVLLPLANYNILEIALQPDNKVVCVGARDSLSDTYSFCMRLKANGHPDSSFGTNGVTIVPMPAHIFGKVQSVVVQDDGKILLAGTQVADTVYSSDLFVSRLNADGQLDTTFGKKGFTVFADSVNYDLLKMKILHNGDIAIGATLNLILPSGLSIDTSYISVKCLLPDGSRDAKFGINGSVIYQRGNVMNYQRGISFTEQPSGKLLLIYRQIDTSFHLPYFKILQLNADGSIDISWQKNGDLNTQVNSVRNAVLISNGNKFIMDVQAQDSTHVYDMIKRFNADGSTDISFADSGIFIIQRPLIATTGSVPGDIIIDTNTHLLYASICATGYSYILRLKLEGATSIPFLPNFVEDAYLYPNPSEGFATLHFTLRNKQKINISVCNAAGQLMRVFSEQLSLTAGSYNIPINLSGMRAGIYFVRLESSDGEQVLRLSKQ